MFRKKTLESILSTFDRVATDLTRHVEKKAEEQFELLADKSYIEDLINKTEIEVDRAHRVLSKMKDLLS